MVAAAHEGLTTIVELLLRHGANPNRYDRGSRTALSYAAQEGHDEVVAHLLSYGADPNIRDKQKATALLWGACRGNENIVRRLIAIDGINLNPVDEEGMTALTWAIERRYGEIAEIIAEALPLSKSELVNEVLKWRVLLVKSAGT